MSGETVSYTYDSLNRLATASGCTLPSGCTPQTELWGQAYVYDPFGNLLQKNITAGSGPSLASRTDNQIVGGSHDANGNTGGVTSRWRPEGSAMTPRTGWLVGGISPRSKTSIDYYYDSQNRRIWSWAGAVDPENNTTNFTVNVYTPSGQKLGAYLLAPAFVQNSQTEFAVVPSMQVTLSSSDIYFGSRRVAVMDQLGSAGNTASQAGTYYPWGEPKGTTNPQNTWSFATYWQDSNTGLDYANYRYYSNSYGRFVISDPYTNSGRLSDPESWNRYAHTRGDPLTARDPAGRMINRRTPTIA